MSGFYCQLLLYARFQENCWMYLVRKTVSPLNRGLFYMYRLIFIYSSIRPLLGLRFIQGIFFSIITTAAGSLAADIVPAKRKGAGLGYFTMSTNLAVVIGPFIGLLLIQYSTFNVLFIVMSICILAGGILAFTVNTDDLPKPAHEGKLTFKFDDLFERKALPVVAIASLVAFSYASVLSFYRSMHSKRI